MEDIDAVRRALGEHGEDLVLVDVRRTGKTTVAQCSLELLANAGHHVYALDAMENAPSAADLAERLCRQLAAYRSGRLRTFEAATSAVQWIAAHGRGVVASIEDAETRAATNTLLAVLGTQRRTGVEQLVEVLDQIEAEAAVSGRRAVVLCDEVQAIVDWPDTADLQKELRLRLRRSDGNIAYLFAGSRPTIVETLFRRGGMLDFQGVEHRLRSISEVAWHEGLTSAFQSLGTAIEGAAIRVILDASEGHPLRTMLAARETHALAERRLGAATEGVAVIGAAQARRQHLWQIEDTP